VTNGTPISLKTEKKTMFKIVFLIKQ